MQPDKINHNETLLSKPLITWILLAFACLTLPVALAQSNTVPDASAPEVTTSAQTNDSLHAQNIRKLLAIKEALEEKRARIRDLVEQLGNADEVDQEKLRGKITTLRQTIADLELSFENIAVSGASLRRLQDEPLQPLSWHDELMQVARPLLNSLKEATEKPRRIEELRRETDLYQQQLEVTRRATEALARFDRQVLPPGVAAGLTELETTWRERSRDIERSLELARGSLNSLESEEVDLLSTLGGIAHEFFLGRGLTLLIALLTGIGIWFSMRALRELVRANRPAKQDAEKAARLRLLFYAYHILTVVLVALAVLSVFYVRGDLLLLSLAIITLVMLTLGIWRYLPRYIDEGRLLLNVGAAREGERVIYQGLPFCITSLNLYSELRNPELDGVIRLPLSAVAKLISRPRGDDAWFPCRVGDYLLLADGSFAHVLQQSIEWVRLKVKGSIVQIATVDFLQQPARNLSVDGFGITVTFGIDYQHQQIALQQVPEQLRTGISAAFAASDYADDLKDLKVAFKAASASSLDYLIYASINGNSAASYIAIGPLIQQTCVDICNQQGWIIPFTQVTLHQAENPTPAESPKDTA
jgi:polyhydroxyalkanoate synthesis regulator phasin